MERKRRLTQLSSSHNVRLSIIYRPQNISDGIGVPAIHFSLISNVYLESVVMCEEQLIIIGDFSCHVDTLEDTETIKNLGLLESFCLQQHVE